MFNANIVPGQGFELVQIYEKESGQDKTGRVSISEYKHSGRTFYGILAEASQQDKDIWRQNQHPITHTIVQYGAMQKAKATDYLLYPDGRKFYVQGVDNAANLNVAMIYYVDERFDIK